jgi:hypothetical protein
MAAGALSVAMIFLLMGVSYREDCRPRLGGKTEEW